MNPSDDIELRWTRSAIFASSCFFMTALLISGIFEPRIRLLHVLQAIIYVAVIVLTRRKSAIGYGIGCFMCTFWNYMFIRSAAGPLGELFSGHLFRPDLVIQVMAAIANFLIVVACFCALWQSQPKARQWIEFFIGGVASIGYFVLIVFTTGPLYIPLVKRAFGL